MILEAHSEGRHDVGLSGRLSLPALINIAAVDDCRIVRKFARRGLAPEKPPWRQQSTTGSLDDGYVPTSILRSRQQ
jgi:hypothetical protein